jgi:uncharacterized RDD family membrane protein YckC
MPTRLQLDGTHTVLTPEYVEFTFVLAGALSRFLALLIDTVISLVLAIIIIAAAARVLGSLAPPVIFVSWFAIDWGYMIALESLWSGQTIGKRVMGLRVIQESGVRVGLVHSALRNLLRPIDRAPAFYLLGGVSMLLTGHQQRLGDLLAGTVVVREQRRKIPSSLARPEGDTSMLRDSDFLARVAKLTPEEEALLFSAALRREELGIEARLTLFSHLANRLHHDLGFQKPEHFSDEKLVMFVTAAVTARRATTKSTSRR